MSDTLIGELTDADPTTLIVGTNVRTATRLGKQFVASIRERGVLEPVVAYRDDDGQLVVLRGQRRTLGACEAGRDRIPVYVVARPTEPDRIVDQLIENEHRAELETLERVAGYEQLVAFGVSAAQIARKAAVRRPDVNRALAVAHSKTAAEAMTRHSLSLEHAAVLAEFENDRQAVKDLINSARYGGFDHMAQRLRDARTEAVARAAAEAELTTAGVKVGRRSDFPAARLLGALTDKDTGQVLTAEGHAGCRGHAAYFEQRWARPAGDEPETLRWVPVYLCTDWVDHQPIGGGSAGPSRSAAGTPAVDADDAREAARIERRDVIRSNKAWDSAEVVRREWLRTFLARKTAPKTAAAFIGTSLARNEHPLSEALTNGHRDAHDLLGLGRPPTYGQPKPLVDLLSTATDSRAQMIALGLVLAAYEGSTHRQSWRNAREDGATARYLRYLETHGYELSEVELRACGVQPAAGPDHEGEAGDE